MTIMEVVDHKGDPQRPTTMRFMCRVSNRKEVLTFAFLQCKFVEKIKEYIKSKSDLKALLSKIHYKDGRVRKKSKKLTDSLKGYS